MKKSLRAAIAMALIGSSAASLSVAGNNWPAQGTHRYLIERTFPAGALDGVDAAAKKKVNANNKSVNVDWEKSYANADKTHTYCVYDGPSEDAVREAAKLSGMPVDSVVEIPVDIKAEPRGAVHKIHAGNQRFLVKRDGSAQVNGKRDATFGVTLLTSYGTADHRGSYWVYEAPNQAAIEKAAKASGAPFESIAAIPETLYPN